MDAIELARQHAAALHQEGVQRGLDPWKPMEFARGLALAKDWRVEHSKRGAELLEGGRAILLPDDELILFENEGTPFDQAFLIAHELGHAELGDVRDRTPVSSASPARSAEPSPVGIDRVVDYSRRQRREVQMDLFARELLLPRGFARALHVDRGMTCTDIADRLGAPFEVVAQQLLDALLLPPCDLVADEPSCEDTPLNEEQRTAATHKGEALLLQAGPGTGKTKTLVARVEALLEAGIDPRRILMLTFSNKAAAEMAERIARRFPAAAAAVWVGTFHGFGFDLVRRFGKQLGLSADVRLMDRTEAVELLEVEYARLGLKHYRNLYDPVPVIADLLNAISRAKDEVVDANGYRKLAESMLRTAAGSNAEAMEAAERALEVAAVYDAYEAIKRTSGCVDFGDLVMLPVQLLEQDAEVRALVQAAYQHVLVDEYQDVNRSSVRLLSALKPDGQDLWVVGDAKQSIYRFRGASAVNLARFGKEDFAAGSRQSLVMNYRSLPEVVDAFSAFAATMATRQHEPPLVADRARIGRRPALQLVADGSLVSAAVADAILDAHARGVPFRDQAVLCRGNDKLAELAQDLERLGIPVLFLGSLFERQEVKDLVALLSLLTDRRATGLLRIGCWPEFAMQLEDVVALIDHLRVSAADSGAWQAGCAALSTAGQAQVAKLAAAFDGFTSASDPWTVLSTLMLDRTRVAADLYSDTGCPARSRGIAIWQFLNFIRVQPRGVGLPIVRLMDRIRRLLRLRDERDLRQLPLAAQRIDAVRLMTIHGSKGLEFRAVHLAGVNQDSIPGSAQPDHCPPPIGMVAGATATATAQSLAREMHADEQECLFYVALSRAQDELYLYAATHKGNTKRPLSPFVNRVRATIDERSVVPEQVVLPAVESAPLVLMGALPTFHAQELALYERCARRFFYTYLLNSGGRRTSSAFMLMHEVVREVFESMMGIPGPPPDQLELDARLDRAFARQGLREHGYAMEYRAIAAAMVGYFVASRRNATVLPATALSLMFGDEQVLVRPDEVLMRGGTRTLRRVRTGHASRAGHEDIGSAALLIAAAAAFPGAIVEIVYLADETVEPLSMTARKLSSRREKVAKVLSDIAGGRFEAKRSSYACSNCPAFFVCGPVPPGPLPARV